MKVFQPVKSIQDLKVGEIIINVGSINSYVIVHQYGSHAVAVRTVDVSNPIEWSVLRETDG